MISAAKNLDRKIAILTSWLLGMVVVGGVLVAWLPFFAAAKVKETNATIQEAQTSHLSDEGLMAVREILISDEAGSTVLADVFPDATSFPGVISELEQILIKYDPAGKVQLTSNSKPTKVQNELAVTFSLQLRGAAEMVAHLMTEIESLPYIMEIYNVDVRWDDSEQETVQTNLGVRLYVQDPFGTL